MSDKFGNEELYELFSLIYKMEGINKDTNISEMTNLNQLKEILLKNQEEIK